MRRAAAPALLLALVACGGESTPPPGLSKAEFIAQADTICAAATKELAKIEIPDNPSVDDVLRAVNVSLLTIEPTVEKLDALEGAPAEEEALEANLIAPTRLTVAAAKRFVRDVAAAGQDEAKREAAAAAVVGSLEDPKADEHDKALKDHGFGACAETNT